LAQPLENFKPIHAGHFEVEHQHVREREILSIFERGSSVEVLYSVFTVLDELHGSVDSRSKKSSFQKKSIVRIVLSDKNFDVTIHSVYTFFRVLPGTCKREDINTPSGGGKPLRGRRQQTAAGNPQAAADLAGGPPAATTSH
jgi:hypothetical protein